MLADIPCVGVGKKLYHVDGLQKGPEHKQKVFNGQPDHKSVAKMLDSATIAV